MRGEKVPSGAGVVSVSGCKVDELGIAESEPVILCLRGLLRRFRVAGPVSPIVVAGAVMTAAMAGESGGFGGSMSEALEERAEASLLREGRTPCQVVFRSRVTQHADCQSCTSPSGSLKHESGLTPYSAGAFSVFRKSWSQSPG